MPPHSKQSISKYSGWYILLYSSNPEGKGNPDVFGTDSAGPYNVDKLLRLDQSTLEWRDFPIPIKDLDQHRTINDGYMNLIDYIGDEWILEVMTLSPYMTSTTKNSTPNKALKTFPAGEFLVSLIVMFVSFHGPLSNKCESMKEVTSGSSISASLLRTVLMIGRHGSQE